MKVYCIKKNCNNEAKYKLIFGKSKFIIYYCECCKNKDINNEYKWVKL